MKEKKVVRFQESRDGGFSKNFSNTIVILGRRENHLILPQEGNLLVEYTGELPVGPNRRKKIIFARALATVRGEAEKVAEEGKANISLLNLIIEKGSGLYVSPLGLSFWLYPHFAWQDEEIQAKYGEEAVKVALYVVYSPDGKQAFGHPLEDPEIRDVIFKGKGGSLISCARGRNRAEQEKNKKQAGFKKAFLDEHPEMAEALVGVGNFRSCMERVRELGFGSTFRHAHYDGHDGVEWNEFSITVGGQKYSVNVPDSYYVEKEKDYL